MEEECEKIKIKPAKAKWTVSNKHNIGPQTACSREIIV
jgi:hypothetical protein